MKQRRSIETRDRILESGMNVLFAEGTTSLSLRQVAKAAGITPMAIYRHFDDKDSLELALLEHAFELFESYLKGSSTAGTPSENLVSLATRFFDFAIEREPHFRFLFLSGARPPDGGRGSIVRSISRPTFLLLKEGLAAWAQEASVDVQDLNSMTVDTLAFCVGQVALVLSGNLIYAQKDQKRELAEAFDRYLALMILP
ncbi:MAG: TetR/AcrR family transcriptional regulator [Pseudomonadota bacterium]